jgi:hypothetical protein
VTAARALLVVVLLAVDPAGEAAARRSEADAAFAGGRWEEAAQLYEKALALDPGSGPAWFRLGEARLQLGRHAPAATALERAERQGAAPRLAAFRLACAYGGLGRQQEAREALERAVAAGFGGAERMKSAPELALLKEDAGFERLLERARRPCEHLAGYARLDFWVGEWDVLAGGETVGRNRVERTLQGCAVVEHWTDVRGGTGKSLFYFDPVRCRWKQVWVDDRGGFKEKEETDPPGPSAIRFQGTLAQGGGVAILDRTTLTALEGGRLRQLIETSLDGGRTWSPQFDSTHVPTRRN